MLKVDNLRCHRGHQILFSNLTFELPLGKGLIITGANGSGKSSLLRILAGLRAADAGKIQRPSELIYLGHQPGFKLSLTALDNLIWWYGIQGITAGNNANENREIRENQKVQEIRKIQEKLASLNLAHLSNRPCWQLSAGQLQRFALSRLILRPASLWILDEPWNALDAEAKDWLEYLLLNHLKNKGMLVMASHQFLMDTMLEHEYYQNLILDPAHKE